MTRLVVAAALLAALWWLRRTPDHPDWSAPNPFQPGGRPLDPEPPAPVLDRAFPTFDHGLVP